MTTYDIYQSTTQKERIPHLELEKLNKFNINCKVIHKTYSSIIGSDGHHSFVFDSFAFRITDTFIRTYNEDIMAYIESKIDAQVN